MIVSLLLSVGFTSAIAATVTASFSSATDVPVTAPTYIAAGSDLVLSLGFAPATGTDLMVVNNTGLPFISGQFTNLAHGQEIELVHNGIIYKFVADYFGGSGNDLVLHWQRRGIYSWGDNSQRQLGDNRTSLRRMPVAVFSDGVLMGRTAISVNGGNTHSIASCSDGTVATWGANFQGQLGNGLIGDSGIPVRMVAQARPSLPPPREVRAAWRFVRMEPSPLGASIPAVSWELEAMSTALCQPQWLRTELGQARPCRRSRLDQHMLWHIARTVRWWGGE